MKLWHDKKTWVSRNAHKKLARLGRAEVKTVAVIKHAGYGDLLCTRPFLVTLRQNFPHTKITFSAIGHYRAGIPEDLVDRVHVVPARNERKGWRSTLRDYATLGHHSLLFDLTASTPSFLISALNSADFKIGFQHRSVHKLIYDAAIMRAEYRFEAETFLEQLHMLGISFDWPPPYALPVQPLHRVRPYCVYFPTASNLEKSWPAEKFISLIQQAATQYSHFDHIILSGLAQWEVDTARTIVTSLANHPNVLLDSDRKDYDRLIKGATVLVSNDTGIRHLGIAVGTPTVGIFMNTIPFGYWPHFGRHEVVYHQDGGIPAVATVERAMARILIAQNSPID